MQKSNLNNIEVVFFDIDGTLFDKELAHKKALKKIMNRYEIFQNVDESKVIDSFKKADHECVRDFDNGVPMKDIRWKRSKRVINYISIEEDFTDTFHEEFNNIYPSVDAEIEDAVKTVKQLHSDNELGIITNSTKKTQFKKLNTLNIKNYFDEFIFSEEIGSRKPDEKIFLTALDRIDKEPGRCLYVGDSFKRDVMGAKKVGIRTCWFNKDKKKKTEKVKANLEISKLKQLLKFF